MGIWSKLGLAVGLTVVTTTAWAGPARRARPGTTRATAAPSRPLIEVKVNGQIYDGHSPISKRSNITVQAKAARGEQGQYDLLSVSLLAQRSLGAPTKLADFVGEGDTVRVALGN
ncbi:MAG: hypothetical protein KC613_21015, partial [Myxococcales bacterium]|nr:hypothetical protein [Myxococcales bacterium]